MRLNMFNKFIALFWLSMAFSAQCFSGGYDMEDDDTSITSAVKIKVVGDYVWAEVEVKNGSDESVLLRPEDLNLSRNISNSFTIYEVGENKSDNPVMFLGVQAKSTPSGLDSFFSLAEGGGLVIKLLLSNWYDLKRNQCYQAYHEGNYLGAGKKTRYYSKSDTFQFCID